jgi:hypothetical protein
MRTLLVAGLTGLGLLMAAGAASAQTGYGRYSRPNYGPGYRGNISPYLNIDRGNNVGINYFLGTRSEQQRRTDARLFRSEIDDIATREGEPAITSGTAPQPNSLQRYFNNKTGYFPPVGPTIPLIRR